MLAFILTEIAAFIELLFIVIFLVLVFWALFDWMN